MGKDRLTIFMKDVHIDALSSDMYIWETHLNKNFWKTHNSESFNAKYNQRRYYYSFGSMTCDAGVVRVEYLRYSSTKGDMLVSLSVADLYHGNNSLPKSIIDKSEFIQRLLGELRCVMDINELPPTDIWSISKDETNIDLIDTTKNLKVRFNLLRKIKLPYRKGDFGLADDGTFYYYSGKNRKKSGAQVIVYFKVREQEHKHIDIRSLLNISDNQECLRIEIKDKKSSLKRKVAKVNAHNNAGNSAASSLDTVISKEYQIFVISDFISKCGFNKIITTKERLNRVVENSPIFTKKTTKTCKRVIRFLNGEIANIDLNSRTVDRYKKKILLIGYHYLYADSELAPITLAEVERVIAHDKTMVIKKMELCTL